MSHIVNPSVRMYLVIGLVQGLWFLLHYWTWALIKAPPGYPVVALCCGDPTALDLQIRSLHIFQQTIDGVDDGAGQFITLGLGLGCRVGLLDVKWAQFSLATSGLAYLHLHSYDYRTCSPTHLRHWWAGQRASPPTPYSTRQMRSGKSSPMLTTWGLAHSHLC